MGKIRDKHTILWKDSINKRVMNTNLAEGHIHSNPGISIFSRPMKAWQLQQEG